MSAAQSSSGQGRNQQGRGGGQSGSRPPAGGRGQGGGNRGQGGGNRGQGGGNRGQGPNRGGRGPGGPGRPPAGRPISARGPRPSRLTPSTIAIGAVSLVVVIVVVIVAVKVTGGGSSTSSSGIKPPPVTPASSTLLSEVANVPASVQNAVGAWSSVGVPVAGELTAPSVKTGQPALKLGSNSLPAALYIGGEFCPYCGATRWALLMAFDKFGSFSGVEETYSSPWDVYPLTPTLTFKKAKYTSQYINFNPVEYLGQDKTAVDTHTVLTPLTTAEKKVYVEYDTVNGETGVPFVDIGNKVFITGAPIYPQLLSGMHPAQVAATLTNAKSQITQAIVGTANDLIAGVCSVDGQQPAAVCSNPGVQAAASALNLN